MKNITITLDIETADWARVAAAQKGLSVSRFVGEVLREKMGYSRQYEHAMRHFLSRRPVMLGEPGEKLPTREEIYDRPILRRDR
jgi:hypothetical protein